MKLFSLKNLLILFLAVVCGFVVLTWDYLKNIGLVVDYLDTFAPENVATNFRSMYERYPSSKIDNQGQTVPLETALIADALPEFYTFLDEQRRTADFIAQTNTTGLAILHNNKLVFESYREGNTAASHAIQMSVGKVYTSFLVGRLLQEGHIQSTDEPVDAYVSELKGTAFEGVTIQQLLDMTTGIRWVEDISDITSELVRSTYASLTDTMDEFVRSIVREREPGTFHHYATVNHYVLGLLIRDASGMGYNEYFQQQLWNRIGAESHAWLQGNPGDVAAMPYVRLRDMLRFGAVYAHEGRNLAGTEIISPEWVSKSSRPDHPMLEPGADNPLSSSYHGYKHQWWFPVGHDQEFAALGIFGQVIYVNQKYNVVIAKTAAYQGESQDGGWRLMEAVILFQQTARWLQAQAERQES